MSKKLLKILALALSAVLLVGATIAGTVAYLTSTAQVSNTFTFGNVSITMDEAKVNAYGELLTGRVPDSGNVSYKNNYKLIPGHEYIKDTQIHVAAGSESCYLFVKIDETFADVTNVEARLQANYWKPIAQDSTIYYYSTPVENVNGTVVNENTSVVVFDVFTADTDATFTNFNADIIAYAVQSDGFASAAAAWTATFGAPPAQS